MILSVMIPENINDKNYGNNDVSAGYQSHGTHLSGIIAAIRGNSTWHGWNNR